MSIKITNKNKLLRGLKQSAINDVVSRDVINIIREKSEKDIKYVVLDAFNDHPLIKSLMGFNEGDEEQDLPAVMGLSFDQAERASREIATLIRDALRIEFQNRNEKGRFTTKTTLRAIIYFEELEDNIRNMSSGEYSFLSKKHGLTYIPWIEWVLDGHSLSASIEFDLNADQSNVSRSGRALMIEDNARWSFSKDEFSETPGLNFVQDIFSNPKIRVRIEEIFRQNIERYIINNV